ncbi:MAG: DegT/DnrJ/EryC1/StrS family aminotransferase [Bacteroidetes bacterium]|nr:DegT/DnrJ/EryC1/StrS family aminotransferase [Bacteroidota bacterium]
MKYNIAQPSFLGNEKKYLIDTIDSGWISSIGAYIEKFEKEFAACHNMKHAVATHNGTIALHLALAACGVHEGDEVIVPDLTFIATANSVQYCRAIPVLTDVSLNDWNIDPEEIRQNITPRTKAIIPVHLYGNPARMDEILSIANENNLFVIEDCAEALGAISPSGKVGASGHISCFSFFGNKIITTGEGGMCITNDDELAERMRILRDHGMNRQKKYWYDHLGFNYRMTNMQAAVGLAQLERLGDLLAMRDRIYDSYKEALQTQPQFIFQDTHGNRNVNWIFTIRMEGITEDQRDAVMLDLKQQSIDTRPVFYPIHDMPFYSNEKYSGKFKHSIIISREGISLPTYIGLSDDDIQYISGTLIGSFEKLTA